MKALYIGGHSRSGSPLLDRILGQLPGWLSTGELGYLTTHGLQQNRLCGCGVRFLDRRFWTRVGQAAASTASTEYYDLVRDPGMKHNLYLYVDADPANDPPSSLGAELAAARTCKGAGCP